MDEEGAFRDRQSTRPACGRHGSHSRLREDVVQDPCPETQGTGADGKPGSRLPHLAQGPDDSCGNEVAPMIRHKDVIKWLEAGGKEVDESISLAESRRAARGTPQRASRSE